MSTLQSNQANYDPERDDEIDDLTYDDGWSDGNASERSRCLAWIKDGVLNFMHPEFGTFWTDLFADEQVPTAEEVERVLNGFFKALTVAVESGEPWLTETGDSDRDG